MGTSGQQGNKGPDPAAYQAHGVTPWPNIVAECKAPSKENAANCLCTARPAACRVSYDDTVTLIFASPGISVRNQGCLCAGRAAEVQGKCSWELLLTDFCKSHAARAEEHGAVRRTTPAVGSHASPLPSYSSIAEAGHKGRPPICQHLPAPSKLYHLSTPQRILASSIGYLSVVSLGHPTPSFCQELKENLESTPDFIEPNVVAWLL
nr:uncharacterized protein LOC110358928 [Columba livia]